MQTVNIDYLVFSDEKLSEQLQCNYYIAFKGL